MTAAIIRGLLSHPTSSQETKERAEQLLPALETGLTPQQWQSIQAQAPAMTLEAMVAEFLRS